MENRQTQGQQLKAFRMKLAEKLGLKKKVTQRQFADLFGVTRNTVARWERDQVTPVQQTWAILRYIDFLLDSGVDPFIVFIHPDNSQKTSPQVRKVSSGPHPLTETRS